MVTNMNNTAVRGMQAKTLAEAAYFLRSVWVLRLNG